MPVPNLIVVMGVSGCGKSTIGKALAEELDIPFFDGDDFHPPANRRKMENGVALNDEDRSPWLAAICTHAKTLLEQDQSLVVACSALKRIYRDQLRMVEPKPLFVHLHAPQKVIAKRQVNRTGHFMPPGLLPSQYQTLESTSDEPDAIEVSGDQPLAKAIESVIASVNAKLHR